MGGVDEARGLLAAFGTMGSVAKLSKRLCLPFSGAQRGLQFVQSGMSLSVPVRANIQAGRLVAYQVDVLFDASVFEATAATSGAMDGFDKTLNDPPEMVTVSAVDATSTVQGSAVSLGTVSLSVKQSAVTLIHGNVIELVRYALGSYDTLGRYAAPIQAGVGYAAVQLAKADLIGDPLPRSEEHTSELQSP